jgi:heat shock 70kDa protein 4
VTSLPTNSRSIKGGRRRRHHIRSRLQLGLNVLRSINDTTAVSLDYGITKWPKSDLPDPGKPRHVVFIDVGHSSLFVAVDAFSKGQLVVKSPHTTVISMAVTLNTPS